MRIQLFAKGVVVMSGRRRHTSLSVGVMTQDVCSLVVSGVNVQSAPAMIHHTSNAADNNL